MPYAKVTGGVYAYLLLRCGWEADGSGAKIKLEKDVVTRRAKGGGKALSVTPGYNDNSRWTWRIYET